MQTVVTHSGDFHTDDVFAIAFLELYLGTDNFNLTRTRDESVIEQADWVIDVGGVYDPEQCRFDHHQAGAPTRENGVTYSAFGLMWRHFGVEVCGDEKVSAAIDSILVLPIDANDNGFDTYELNERQIKPYTIDAVCDSYLPAWNSSQDPDKQFGEAVSFAKQLLKRIIEKERSKLAKLQKAQEVYESSEDKRILVSDSGVGSSAFVQFPEVLCVVQPDKYGDGRWCAIAIPKNETSFDLRAHFPADWAGLRGDELERVSGIKGAVFCHTNLFFFVGDSKKTALSAAQQLVKN